MISYQNINEQVDRLSTLLEEENLEKTDFDEVREILQKKGGVEQIGFKDIVEYRIGKILNHGQHADSRKNNIIIDEKIIDFLKMFNFVESDKLFLKKKTPTKQFYSLLKNHRIDDCKRLIKDYLISFQFDKADDYFNKVSNYYPSDEYREERSKYYQKYCFIKKIKKYLEKDLFLKADNLFLDSNVLSVSEYEKLKTEYIEKDLEQLTREVKQPFDKEKAMALATTGQNILVQARAGSGKTTLVALKVRQLIKCYGVKPEEILILAFNRKAAEQFQERINKYCQKQIADKTNSSTFHSLAHRLVNPGEQLLFNDAQNNNEFVRGQQSEFIGGIYDQILAEDRGTILTLLYNFFKALAKEKIPADFNGSEANFYLYRKNLQYVSLGGERVKSKGEKFIADLLFEHKISKNNQELEYKYEWNLPGGRRRYKPDFSFWSINQPRDVMPHAILEHFGVTRNHPADEAYMSEEEERKYLEEIEWKRIYCQQNHVLFLSTSVDDFDRTTEFDERVHFEQNLKNLLEGYGFTLQRLEQNEIIRKMLEAGANLSPLFDQITQFINRAKKQLLPPVAIQNLAKNDDGLLGDRATNFIEIARRVYERYQVQLKKRGKIDFDDLLVKAIETIKQTNGECGLEILGKTRSIKNLKYILVDEYQDLSSLFYKLLDEIRKANPSINFFCVGDDWQAINSFAGSDLKYFENFEKEYFKGGRRASLLTNHRSFKDIVNHSNLVMSGRGDGGLPEENKPPGAVYLCSVPYVEWRIENQKKYADDKTYRDRARLLGCWQNKEMEVSRYLKIVEKIVNDNENNEICFLFRTNNFYGVKIEEFKNKIEKWFPTANKIICSTAHSYKGKERNVVVVVDANRKNYPKIHPDNELMEILGVTLSKVVEEERRLFYVAVTRAKEKLYMLYEEDLGYSDFIPSQWIYQV